MASHSISILGVMTGTSCDSLDAVCVRFPKDQKIKSWSIPYPKDLRRRVLEIQKPGSTHSLKKILFLHRDLGEWYGSTIKKVNPKADLISLHGQTVAHFPPLSRKKGGSSIDRGATLQLGDPSIVAHLTGIPVASHLRHGDMAAHGQGAPLAPLYHEFLFKNRLKNKGGTSAFLNLGGISNLTLLGKTPKAWDTGPGNLFLDFAISRVSSGKYSYDRDGQYVQSLLRKDPNATDRPEIKRALKVMLQHSYFKMPVPKSTGRDQFTLEWFSKILLQSNVRPKYWPLLGAEICVQSVCTELKGALGNHALKNLLVCGGGAKNPYLMMRLQTLLSRTKVTSTDLIGVDPQEMESRAFAYLGWLTLCGKPSTGPWTGAAKSKVPCPPIVTV